MLIGIVGFAGAGKGTVADLLVKEHGFKKLAFADTVKDATSAIFGWPRKLLEGDTEESRKFREKEDAWWSSLLGWSLTPRHALQLLGTESGRNVFGEDIWLHTVANRMMPYNNVVVPDVRFSNEIEFIRGRGGFIIRVSRGKDPDWYNVALKANHKNKPKIMKKKFPEVHESEWKWIGTRLDYMIENNSSISMLDADIKHMIKVFARPKKV